jgi:hypothetical protein
MKIHLDKSMGVQSTSETVRPKSVIAQGTSFSEYLNGAMKEENQSENVRTASEIQPMSPIPTELMISGSKEVLAKGIGRMLDALESYQGLLASPASSLRDMVPLVNRIETDLEKLSSIGQPLSDNDPLKEILNQTLITAGVEVTRFNRGDYIVS